MIRNNSLQRSCSYFIKGSSWRKKEERLQPSFPHSFLQLLTFFFVIYLTLELFEKLEADKWRCSRFVRQDQTLCCCAKSQGFREKEGEEERNESDSAPAGIVACGQSVTTGGPGARERPVCSLRRGQSLSCSNYFSFNQSCKLWWNETHEEASKTALPVIRLAFIYTV